MIASAQASAASMNDTVTAGPAKSPAARAPTEKIPAPTATATPRIIRSQALSGRLSWWPGSCASAIDCSMDLVRNRLMRGLTVDRETPAYAMPGRHLHVGLANVAYA